MTTSPHDDISEPAVGYRIETVRRAVFERSAHFAVLLARDGRVLDANPAALGMGGTPREAVIGCPFWETPWLRGEDGARGRVRTMIDRACAGEGVHERIVLSTGDQVAVLELSLTAIDAGPDTPVLLAEGREITEAEEAYRALRMSEAKFAGIFAISADAIISIDEDQRIIHFNRGAEQIFGWSEAEALGQPLDILLPERYRDVHREHIKRFANTPVAARRMGERQEIAGLRKDDEEFPADASISKIDVDGRRIFTVVLRDITSRKQAERAQRFLARAGEVLAESLDYETTLSSITRLPVPALADWCVIYALEADGIVRRLAFAHAEPAKETLIEAFRNQPLERARPHPVFDALDAGEPVYLPEIGEELIRAMSRDQPQLELYGELGMRSALVVPLVARGQTLGAMGFFSTTPGGFTEEDAAVAQDLALRAALALDNARLYGEARAAVRARDEVLAVVSHDLGNPLSAIRIGTSLLLKSIPPEDRERGGWQHLESIRQSAVQMERLISDLIEVKRIEAGSLAFVRGRYRAATLIAETTDLFGAIAGGKGIALETVVAPMVGDVHVDRERTLQVLSNLVGNAIKFTPAGGRITLSAMTGDHGTVEFTVADTGMGISAEHLDHVFDRFWQANRGRREGIGLGLAIARGIVHAQGGEIWADSREGEGATFSFSVPAADASTDP